jgi:hypothetical protein
LAFQDFLSKKAFSPRAGPLKPSRLPPPFWRSRICPFSLTGKSKHSPVRRPADKTRPATDKSCQANRQNPDVSDFLKKTLYRNHQTGIRFNNVLKKMSFVFRDQTGYKNYG